MGYALRLTEVAESAGFDSRPRAIGTSAPVESAPTFQEVYTQFRPLVVRICRWFVRDPYRVEDLVHDVFIETMEHLPSVPDGGSLAPWIATLAKRRCIDEIRRKYRVRGEEPAGLRFDDGPDVDEIERLIDALDAREELRLLAPVLRKLTDKQRYVLMRIGVDDWDRDEIADAMGLTRLAARGLLFRARAKIQRHLANNEAPTVIESGEKTWEALEPL